MGYPFCEPLDKYRADAEFAGEVVDGVVPPGKFSFDLLDDIAEVLVIGEGDIEDIGEIRQVTLEICPELVIGRTGIPLSVLAGFRHPPLLLDKVSFFKIWMQSATPS